MLSSFVKRSPLLWPCNKSRLWQKKIKVKWFVISFNSVYTKNISLEEKFCISARPCNILYLFVLISEQLVEAIVLPMTHKERFENLGIAPPKGNVCC